MARHRDWVGWQQTIEEVERDEEVEINALRNLIRVSKDPQEAAEVAMALGIDHHLETLLSEN